MITIEKYLLSILRWVIACETFFFKDTGCMAAKDRSINAEMLIEKF